MGLDSVRQTLYVALRAQERFAVNLRAVVESLENKTDHDEWLELVLVEASKGKEFYEGQLRTWSDFQMQVS